MFSDVRPQPVGRHRLPPPGQRAATESHHDAHGIPPQTCRPLHRPMEYQKQCTAGGAVDRRSPDKEGAHMTSTRRATAVLRARSADAVLLDRVWTPGVDGRVDAVFRHVINVLTSDGQLIALASRSNGDAPWTLVVEVEVEDWSGSAVVPGQVVRFGAGSILLPAPAGDLRIDTRAARRWNPIPVSLGHLGDDHLAVANPRPRPPAAFPRSAQRGMRLGVADVHLHQGRHPGRGGPGLCGHGHRDEQRRAEQPRSPHDRARGSHQRRPRDRPRNT